VLDVEHPVSAIVFCRTRTEVDELAETLTARGYRAEALHGGLSQDQRDRVMQRFRGRKSDLLVATDVAARGLDVQHVSHVVNYDVPMAAEAYVHRIGRTGRAGRTGVAITLAEPREHRMLRNIERVTRQRIEIAPVPTVADLRARRDDALRTKIREAIGEGNLDRHRRIVEALAEEFDVMDVAAAALKSADSQADTGEEHEIPAPTARPERSPHPSRPQLRERTSAPRRRAERQTEETAMLWIGGGRAYGITPANLVGAIANEAGVSGQVIGAIRIEQRHSTVEVPAAIADRLVAALRGTYIKGKRLTVRRSDARD